MRKFDTSGERGSKLKIQSPIFWLLHLDVFPLREQNFILFGKGKGFTFEELFKSPFTELAFESDYKKELMLKACIQVHQILKTS